MTPAPGKESLAVSAPANVQQVCEAIARVPGGVFTALLQPGFLERICFESGAPLFAIATLAEDVLAKPTPVDRDRRQGRHVWTLDGGRWLALGARIFHPACRMSFVVCAKGKHESACRGSTRSCGSLAQRIFNRKISWNEYLADTGHPPDALLLHGLHVFEWIWDAVHEPSFIAVAQQRRGPAVVQFDGRGRGRAGAAQGARLRRQRRRRVRRCADGESFSTCVPVRTGCGVRTTSGRPQGRSDDNEKESFKSCYKTYWRVFNAKEGPQQHADVARTYGTIASLSVEGEAVERAVLFGLVQRRGIDIATGRVFDRILRWRCRCGSMRS